jgi:UDP-MurNAc hydroxylase
MKITFLGHAGFLVETAETILIMDAWVSDSGAFDGGWFQFPCNHHLGDYLIEKLVNNGNEKKVYVYVSHEHKDHFDKLFLKRIDRFNFKYVIPRFRRTLLFDQIRSFSDNEILLFEDCQEFIISRDEKIIIYSDDSELNRDSAICFQSGSFNFLNLNDCKIHDRLGLINKRLGKIDVLAAQYSGANWHPTCYEYTEEEYSRISRRKVITKFENTARAIELCKASFYIPSAGPPCFLDPDTINKNFEKDNIFPRETKLLKFLDRRLRNSSTKVQVMTPQDSLILSQDFCFSKGPGEVVTDDKYMDYIYNYAGRFQDFFSDFKRPVRSEEFGEIIDFLRTEFGAKLANFKSRFRIDRPLYVSFTQGKDFIKVNFIKGLVTLVNEITESNHYSMKVNASDIKRIKEGYLTWEDYALSFRMRLNREPDVYQTLIQGFLILEKDDLNYFCDSLLELENKNEKITVEVGGSKYRINRFCPHQGADMKYSWEEDNRFVVCPRHGWRFDVTNNGACLENACSIESYSLEED